MKRILLALFLIIAVVGLFSCGPSANKKLTVNIGGPCDECPTGRLDSILKSMEAYVSHKYDKETGNLIIDIDSTIMGSRQVLNELTEAGYELDTKEYGILTTLGRATDGCCVDEENVDLDMDEGDELVDELEKEADDLSLDLDSELENINLDKVSSGELKNENLIDEEDLVITEDDEVDEKDFRSNQKKKKQ